MRGVKLVSSESAMGAFGINLKKKVGITSRRSAQRPRVTLSIVHATTLRQQISLPAFQDPLTPIKLRNNEYYIRSSHCRVVLIGPSSITK